MSQVSAMPIPQGVVSPSPLNVTWSAEPRHRSVAEDRQLEALRQETLQIPLRTCFLSLFYTRTHIYMHIYSILLKNDSE